MGTTPALTADENYWLSLSSDENAVITGNTSTGAVHLFDTVSAPYISGITPTYGTVLGGTSVTISGGNFIILIRQLILIPEKKI